MTPQEKAEELVEKFNSGKNSSSPSIRVLSELLSKENTLICVDEIIKSHGKELDMNDFDYWNEVKEEIMEDKWIKLSDETPKVFEDIGMVNVIVFCKLWGIYMATCKRILDTNYYEWFDSSGNSCIPPTHWMPLPNPPKE